MLKKRSLSIFLISILILSFLFSSNAVTAQGGGTINIFLPLGSKPSVLTVGNGSVSKLNPFFYQTIEEARIVDLTQVNLLTIDRQGMVVENAITGETRSYNGSSYTYTGAADADIVFNPNTGNTIYTFSLRPGMNFADGVTVSADDLIFTIYTFLDPTYDGNTALRSYPILGLTEYQTQVTDEIYIKYEGLYTSIYDIGQGHTWSSSDPWTQAQQTDVWNRLDQALTKEVAKIIDYVVNNYAQYYSLDLIGFSPEQVYANEGLKVALGMKMWGFANVDTSTKILSATYSGRTWDLDYEYPTLADFADEIMLCYNDDYRVAFPYESADGTDIYGNVKTDFIRYWGPLDPEMTGGIPNISGIKKLDQYTVSIELEGFEAPAIYAFGLPIAPLHYYGSVVKYDYAQNKFGFNYGDISTQRNNNAPMGAGPYQFGGAQGDIVGLSTNKYYYKGEPEIDTVKFVPLISPDVVSSVASGNMDLAGFSYNAQRISEIYSLNSNGEISGDIITTAKINNLGYGYIGINARTVKVGSDPSSTASRNLRKALSTALAVGRIPGIEEYYGGDGASVAEYPIVPSSWASPQPADPGFREAFSVGVDGLPIFTPGMTQAQRVIAAQQAALDFFQAAGFTIINRKVVAAPTGAKLGYEVIVPGGGTGDHPAFTILTAARDLLSDIGITLIINDPQDALVLWDALDSGTQELWTAAWGATIDPDLYQVYHSSNTYDEPNSTHSNHYYIKDDELDILIMQARSSDDQALRKELYRQAFDIIMDWGVEIPTYVRNNFQIFSTQRIDTATITPDITTFWGWQNDIEDMRMR